MFDRYPDLQEKYNIDVGHLIMELSILCLPMNVIINAIHIRINTNIHNKIMDQIYKLNNFILLNLW